MDQLTKRLQLAVDAPGHAYVFVGDEDNISTVRSFAKALQCDESSGLESCGVCLSCRVFDSGNHPDIIYVKTAKTKSIGVDDVRTQIVLQMSEKPFRYRYKIFIVNQQLTPQAQNALLKTIEEPAPFGIFLFLTESADLFLPTVLSRCVVFRMKAETPERADGYEEMEHFARTTAESISQVDILGVFKLCGQFDRWKDSIQDLLDILYISLRDKLRAGVFGMQTTDEQMVDNLAVLSRLDAVISAKKALLQNGNFQMTIETMLLKMKGE